LANYLFAMKKPVSLTGFEKRKAEGKRKIKDKK
jgi:hypothetical protein